MPVDRRIARRFVNAGQEPRVKSSNLSVDRPRVDGFRQPPTPLAASVVNCDICVFGLSAPALVLACQNSCSFPKGRYCAVLPLAALENIVCNERIYLSRLLLFPARRCVRARDLDHAARPRNDRESKPVHLYNRDYQVQAETQT
jgi:hypothetical protein